MQSPLNRQSGRENELKLLAGYLSRDRAEKMWLYHVIPIYRYHSDSWPITGWDGTIIQVGFSQFHLKLWLF